MTYIIQENKAEYALSDKFKTKNVIIELGDRHKRETVVIGGHYDVWGTSVGINDNTVAVATLIKLAGIIKSIGSKEKIDIVFFDREETGFVGSDTYINTAKKAKNNIKYAYILDIIGYGDTPVITSVTKEALASIDTLADVLCGFKGIEQDLLSDNATFKLHGIPSVLIVAAPSKDIVYNESGVTHSYINIRSTVYQTFHNRSMDNRLDIINFNIAKTILNRLASVFTGGQYECN